MSWYYETDTDHTNKDAAPAIFVENAPQETIDLAVNEAIAMLNKCEARWSDGRAHVAGANITCADFSMLARYTMLMTNPGIKNPSYGERTKAHLESSCPNVLRIINAAKQRVQA